MPGVWTITYLGTEKTAAAWGLNAQPRIRTRDRSETVISFRMANTAPESAIPIPFQGKVIIKQYSGWTGLPGGVFSGLMWSKICFQTTQRGRVDGHGQGVMLDFADTIWLLKNTIFQQLWATNVSPTAGGFQTGTTYKITFVGTTNFVAIGASANTVGVTFVATGPGTGNGIAQALQSRSRVILFMDISSYLTFPWSIQSVQWEINEIIAFAATCGISIAAGTIDYSGWFLNYIHLKAVSCWDALLKCLEPIPDAKVWFDDTSGTPTLNVRTRANIAAMTAPTTTAAGPITLVYKGTDAGGRRHESTELTPRYDLIPPVVCIEYQSNSTINGQSAPTWTTDIYPTGVSTIQPFALVAPVDLTGYSESVIDGTLDCEALACVGGTQASKRAWWTSKRGGAQDKFADLRVRFQDTTGAAVTISDATVVDDSGAAISLSSFPNRIVDGTYHSWMKNGTAQVNAIRAHISAKVQFVEYDIVGTGETDITTGNAIRKTTSHEIHCHVTLTNSLPGLITYTAFSFSSGSEIAAAGLAQNIYTARQTLDYDGTHEIVDPGINSGTPVPPLAQIIGHWNVLNLSGGATAWATANMTIAGTEIDLMTNHQRIDIGPNKHLSPQDYNTLLQFFRSRIVYIFAGQRALGYSGTNATVDMARNTPDENSVPGLAVDPAQTNITYATEGVPASGATAIISNDSKVAATTLAARPLTPIEP